jgi:ubiquitin-protein ligase
MNKEDIIRMAREAELICEETAQTQWKEEYDLTPILERFAVLVASAEREECAKVVDAWSDWHGGTEVLAKAIRARSKE